MDKDGQTDKMMDRQRQTEIQKEIKKTVRDLRDCSFSLLSEKDKRNGKRKKVERL